MNSEYFLKGIDDLEALVAHVPSQLLRDDLVNLIIDVLAYAKRVTNIENLNRVILAQSRISTSGLRQALNFFESLDLDGPFDLFPSRSLDPNSLLEEYRSFISRLENEVQTLDPGYVASQLQFGNHSLEDLLWCATNARADLSPIVTIVRNNLDLLDDDQVVEIWSRIQRAFSPDRTYFMEPDPDILGENWLQTTTIPDLKSKIANYVVDFKPRFELRMFEAGRYAIPVTGTPGLATFLSLSDSFAVEEISPIELDLARSLGRLQSYWVETLSQQRIEFQRALGLGDAAAFTDNQEYQRAASLVGNSGSNAERLVLYEVKKLVRAAHALWLYESPVEKALTQYKLGIEVMAPQNIDGLSKKNELTLQKELCRFLIERGIFAVGTKFGRSEIDLLADLPNDGHVIEAKVYKEKQTITERSLTGNLTQLQSYMDQSPTMRRGILVIYNFSPTLISAPRQWVGGRFWFLPVNLQRKPPSGRNRSLTIEPGDGNDLIRVLSVRPHTRG